MPVALRSGPYVFFFYSSNGREPAHVHVRRERRQAKIWLSTIEVAWWSGFAPAELRVIVRLVERHRDELSRSWNEFFSR